MGAQNSGTERRAKRVTDSMKQEKTLGTLTRQTLPSSKVPKKTMTWCSAFVENKKPRGKKR